MFSAFAACCLVQLWITLRHTKYVKTGVYVQCTVHTAMDIKGVDIVIGEFFRQFRLLM